MYFSLESRVLLAVEYRDPSLKVVGVSINWKIVI